MGFHAGRAAEDCVCTLHTTWLVAMDQLAGSTVA